LSSVALEHHTLTTFPFAFHVVEREDKIRRDQKGIGNALFETFVRAINYAIPTSPFMNERGIISFKSNDSLKNRFWSDFFVQREQRNDTFQ